VRRPLLATAAVGVVLVFLLANSRTLHLVVVTAAVISAVLVAVCLIAAGLSVGRRPAAPAVRERSQPPRRQPAPASQPAARPSGRCACGQPAEVWLDGQPACGQCAAGWAADWMTAGRPVGSGFTASADPASRATVLGPADNGPGSLDMSEFEKWSL
jgi:hypothetical protein